MNEYKTIAPFYDWILYPFMRGIRRNVLEIVQYLKPGRIVDVCCGTGDQLRLLQQNGIKALGIDLSAAMLKVAAKGANPVKCFRQDATAMAFRDRSFDLAIVAFALHETEWEKARLILQEIHRILKPAGKLLVVDYALKQNSGSIARSVIHMVEFLAGQQHFKSFLRYNRKGGLMKLVDPDHFTCLQNRHRAFDSIAVRLFQKVK
ncbi:MAG: class I SAM-dependent methyltransferase [Deltaproteobacteria bacterium]|nr:class I SAM-dependent methyltransferase [Deltaproteobacteria bacterium]MBW2177203.1 class I SAM-dependent methyltransferase [Deltaproteobacteria bacterium]